MSAFLGTFSGSDSESLSFIPVSLFPPLYITVTSLFFFLWLCSRYVPERPPTVPRNGIVKNIPLPRRNNSTSFDVVIVSSGIAGSSLAYYLAKSGVNVGLLKCDISSSNDHNANFLGSISDTGMDILHDMELVETLIDNLVVKKIKRVAYVSPYGEKCVMENVNNSYVINTPVASEFILRRAALMGATIINSNIDINLGTLIEFPLPHVPISNPNNDDDEDYDYPTHEKMWELRSVDGQRFLARLLIVADGHSSPYGRYLGLSHGRPTSSYSYVNLSKGMLSLDCMGNVDKVTVFQNSLFPGFSSLLSFFNGAMAASTFVLPGGFVKPHDVDKFQQALLVDYVKEAKVGSSSFICLRSYGQSRLYADQCLVVGEAAGQLSDKFSDNISDIMEAAQTASEVVINMYKEGNYSENACGVYQYLWITRNSQYFFPKWYPTIVNVLLSIFYDAVLVVAQSKKQNFILWIGLDTPCEKETSCIAWSTKLWWCMEIFIQTVKMTIIRVLKK